MTDVKVKDLPLTSSLTMSNKIMALTDDENNTVKIITITNLNNNIISSEADNGITQDNNGKLYVDNADSGVTAGTYQYVKNLIVNSKGKITSVEQGEEAAVPVATSSVKGVVQPDNTTITVNNGIITAVLTGKADVDLSNATPVNSFYGLFMPDYSAGVSISAAYTCPSAGIVIALSPGTSSVRSFWVNGIRVGAYTAATGSAATPYDGTSFLVSANDVVTSTDYIGEINFYPLKGVTLNA